MPQINLLDVQTSNLIAAGEVVERPANVLKELLENAIDAKSTAIDTEIRNGGIDFIRITDNGCGMDREDLPLSVRRHATSKIKGAEDLAAIGTLGFRGEALAAISSTSRFTLMSKQKNALLGHQMTVEGETVFPTEECGCADGTTVIVRDLFFNQPARKKFLKRAQTESAAILQYLQRIAVSHPEIAFRHTVDGVVKLQTAGNGKLADCIWSVYGAEFSSSLVEVAYQEGPYRVKGLITRPEKARSNRGYQSFYINSRFVKSKTMQFALDDAYKSFVKSEKFPGCVLFLELDPGEVDVNVHPAKLEVRFSDERGVYQAVYAAVRKTLSSLSNRIALDEYREAVEEAKKTAGVAVPEIRETKPAPSVTPSVKAGEYREHARDLPLFAAASPKKQPLSLTEEEKIVPREVSVKKATFFEAPLPEKPEEKETALPSEEEAVIPTEKGPVSLKAPVPDPMPEPEQMAMADVLPEENPENPIAAKGTVRGVIFHAFLLYETSSHVYLIDKHAAHERILYEALKKNHSGARHVQMFLEPVFLQVDPVEAASLSAHLTELNEAGLLLEEFGTGAFLLRGIPVEFTGLGEEQLKALLEETAEELSLGGRAGGVGEKRFDRILYSMACKAAVKAGIPSTESDHQWILEKLREMDHVTVCPHGRPVLVAFTKKQIENLFLRD